MRIEVNKKEKSLKIYCDNKIQFDFIHSSYNNQTGIKLTYVE